MANFIPKYVNTLEELHEALKEHASVIILTNEEIIPETKRRVERDSKKRIKRNKKIGVGYILLVGAGLSLYILPHTSIPAMIATGAGLFGAGKIAKNGIVGLFEKMSKELRLYKWIEEVSTDKELVLYRYAHGNMFNPDEDTIVVSEEEVKPK